MYKFIAKIFLHLIILTAPVFAQTNYVFLFDNSGSMSPYYRVPTSNFKLFCNALIRNTVKPEDHAAVLLFSKTEPRRELFSPKVIFKGKGIELDLKKIDSEMVMLRAKDGLLGRTDLIEALDSGIVALKGNRGVIWMLTDNINDVSGMGDESYENTLAFYQRMRNDNNIRKILMYPVPEKIEEGEKKVEGYVIYGLVYSTTPLTQQEYEYYDADLRRSGIKQKAITLKPFDIGTIILIPQKTQSIVMPGKLYYDGKTLRGFGFEEGQQIREVFSDLILKSNLYPYIIRSANLNVSLENFISSDYSVTSLGTQTISPSTISNVSPEGEVKGFSITFIMPEITPKFSFNTIFKEDFNVGGNLVLEVSNVEIEIDDEYMTQFRDLFALASVPDIFKPVIKDKRINTVIPLEIKIMYGPWRLFVLIGLGVLVILILSAICYILLRKKCFTLKVDEDESGVCLNLLGSYAVFSSDSIELGTLKKSITGDIFFKQSKFTLNPDSNSKMNFDVPISIEYENFDMNRNRCLITISDTAAVNRESILNTTSSELY